LTSQNAFYFMNKRFIKGEIATKITNCKSPITIFSITTSQHRE
jgi:hypothetical protein